MTLDKLRARLTNNPFFLSSPPHKINNHLSHAGFTHYHVKNLRNLQFVFEPTPVRARSVDQPSNDHWPILCKRDVQILTPRTLVNTWG